VSPVRFWVSPPPKNFVSNLELTYAFFKKLNTPFV
jgi:hypothetical protein